MPDSHLVRSAVVLFFVLTLPFWGEGRKEKREKRKEFLGNDFLGMIGGTKGRWEGGSTIGTVELSTSV